MKLLIVEDHPSLRDLLARHLRRSGFVVDAAEDGKAALAMLELSQYDAMLLDLGLPDGNGHELMTRFKEVRKEQHIVLVTADDSIESIQRAISAGANGYVVKPYSQEKIHDVVSNYAMVHGGDMAQMQGLNRHH